MPRLERSTLHGATLLTIADPGLPLVRFIVGLRHGALVDAPDRAGATRVALDLLLRGTEQHQRVEFASQLEQLGSTLRISVGSEVALLRGMCLRRNLEPTMALVAEALSSPLFAPDELSWLIDEVVEGLRAERDDDDTVAELFLRRALYAGHPLARSPHGELPDVTRVDTNLIRAWHAARIRAADLIGVLAGDVTPEDTERVAESMLAGVSHAPAEGSNVPPVPEPDGLRILVVDKPARTQVQLRVARPLAAGTDPAVFPLWAGTVAFGGMFTSPLTSQVRDERGWSYVAHAEFDRYARHVAPIVLRSAPAARDAVDCLALELDLLAQLAAQGPQIETLELARAYLLNRDPLQLATAADLMVPAMRNELLGLPPEEILSTPRRLAELESTQVTDAMRERLDVEALVVVMVATATDLVPALVSRLPSAQVDVVDFREGLGL